MFVALDQFAIAGTGRLAGSVRLKLTCNPI